MTDEPTEPLEDEIDESGENLTQQRMDESDATVDAEWPTPASADEEPDEPL